MNALNSLTQEELGSAAQRDRRKRILDATIALASRGGFDAVQMRAVAEQADVALGTLYRYFPSKIHLLVSALGREFERSQAATSGKPIPGDSAEARVNFVLGRTTKILQKDPNLTEALTRAFMFADASVSAEIEHVGMMLTSVLTEAMRASSDHTEPTEEEIAIARVIGDVWLSSLVGWVTGRSSATDVEKSMSVAVRLLLR
ncbi:cholesterol catabolism transcriptional regulator KstR [Nocardioides sp. JQ2195]|uniref:cholesterol catabolism transcriptional regulator KstR n=1 Tax=Nocardioides sp. JQ2195 TaxID=2592334 RepID=UPI00143E573C|nr:cholesterol catabolism transcriptional regulator KstR [Nocardioides sp. JQ2195]QIX26631.1 cholesterol catabolism transcriptional regulator KstR [Nocardioides sp. JQ2195]